MKIKFFITTLAVCSLGILSAQNMKIGYTNAEYILGMLPEAKQIDAELRAYENQLQNQLQAKYKDFQAKMADYQANEASYNDLVRTDKQNELQGLQQSIQEFQASAEESLIKKRNQLLQPAIEKIGTAIKAVAVENGYTHIFSEGTSGVDVLLYASEQFDVTDLILKKLGVTPPTQK